MGPHSDMELAEMREELATYIHWAKDYSMESCRREIDQLTDGQVVREWERMNTAWVALQAASH